MGDIPDHLELEDSDARDGYISDLETMVEENGYPACDPDLIYELVDAEFIRDEAEKEGYDEFAEEIQQYIDGVLGPLDGFTPEKKPIGEFSEEEASLYETAHPFREVIGTFTKEDGEIIHAGDVANQFIEAEERNVAHEALERFETWYRDRLGNMLDDIEGDQFEGTQRTYEVDEFERVAVFNGLRRLLARREYEKPFTSQEMRVP